MLRPRTDLLGIALLCLAGCSGESPDPPPPAAELGADDIGYYCNMIVVNHDGPKGQIFLTGRNEPLWFTSVRDTLAYTMLPDEPRNIAAIYVNDMGRASWDQPEPGTWIDARQAWYVLGSEMTGGMGAPEAVPFRERAAADAFAARHGGEVLVFDTVPEDRILAPVETPQE